MIKKIAISTFGSFTAIATVLGVLEQFGTVSLTKYGVSGFIVLFFICVICSIIYSIFILKEKPELEVDYNNEMSFKIYNRIGVLKSSSKPQDLELDKSHEFYLIERTDILDYGVGDYASIRILKGKNVHKGKSTRLMYKESTDAKSRWTDLEIVAYDLKTNKELRVEPLDPPTQKLYTHRFFINFARPLEMNEEFEIMYFIKIPNELNELCNNDEMMSISLNRYTKKIHTLKFNVILNFEPSNVVSYLRDNEGKVTVSNIRLSEENYDMSMIPEQFKSYILDYNLKHILSLNCDNPLKQTYIINYKK